MRYFTVISIFCFILSACSQIEAPTRVEDKAPITAAAPAKDTLPFPESWLGNWAGALNIYRANQLVQTIPMALEMAAIDTSDNFVWAIIYGEDREAGRRAYELEVIDVKKGHYRVDENNTIKLETYLFEHKLYSWYSVQGTMILSIYEKMGDEMIFEIVAGSDVPVSVTGDTQIEGEDIPKVETFPINTVQRGKLKRVAQ